PLPEWDPSKPYDPEQNRYPKWLYGPNEAGTDLIAILIETPADEAKLEGDWRDSPLDWGIETAPGAKSFVRSNEFSAPLPQKQVMEIATKRAEAKAKKIALAAELPPKRGPGRPPGSASKDATAE